MSRIIDGLSLIYINGYVDNNDIRQLTLVCKDFYYYLCGNNHRGIIKNLRTSSNSSSEGDRSVFNQYIESHYLALYIKLLSVFDLNAFEKISFSSTSTATITPTTTNSIHALQIKQKYILLKEKVDLLYKCKINFDQYLYNNEAYSRFMSFEISNNSNNTNNSSNKKRFTLDSLLCFMVIYQQDNLLHLIINVLSTLIRTIHCNIFPPPPRPSLSSSSSSPHHLKMSNNNNPLFSQYQSQIPNNQDYEYLLSRVKILNDSINLSVFPLYLAVIKGNANLIKFLLSSMPNLYSIQCKLPVSHKSTLFYAPNREIALLLLQLGCRVNEVDSFGMLPIHFHSLNGNLDVVKCLIDDSSINSQDSYQNTPLHLSSLKGQFLVIKFLMSSGARFNVTNKQGRLPIHNACINGNVEIVKFFLELYLKQSLRATGLKTSGSGDGSNLISTQITDKENNTPLDLSVLNNHFAVSYEILKYEGCIINKDELNFKDARRIGSGAFADVYLLYWRNKNVAVKRVKFNKILESGKTETWIREKFILEVGLMVKLSHLPSFVKLYGSCVETDELMLILEFCGNGSLYNLLNTVNNEQVISTLPSINTLSMSIVSGMAYLHCLSPQIIHRDLTSQNVLIDSNGCAKIADFGISRFKNDYGDKTMTSIGNPRWRAPEVTKGQKYSEKVDIFGFGMILYEMFTRKVPFYQFEPVQASFKIANGERPELDSNVIDYRWVSLIQQCWDQNPQNRPSFDSIQSTIQQLPIANIPKIHSLGSAGNSANNSMDDFSDSTQSMDYTVGTSASTYSYNTGGKMNE
ncbi:hypothetical protein CYY_001890 [Polysphondylium violaceum]|uniref:non-specific serine/threonine protein kinase n=1 Tax=Polysphondylium violaceum TaxID=133409 RepID=A0A8J4V3H1_9MYCE|nr:hypothetical protein CYY_001890 [Polysphondylium violaceum]